MRQFIRTGVLIAFCTLAIPAWATTIDTFSFSQSGYSALNLPAFVGTISGSFTANVPATGFITQADLNRFASQFAFTEGNIVTVTSSSNSTSFFSFDANPYTLAAPGPTVDSTLDFVSPYGKGVTVCVGAAAAFGLCGGPGGGERLCCRFQYAGFAHAAADRERDYDTATAGDFHAGTVRIRIFRPGGRRYRGGRVFSSPLHG